MLHERDSYFSIRRLRDVSSRTVLACKADRVARTSPIRAHRRRWGPVAVATAGFLGRAKIRWDRSDLRCTIGTSRRHRLLPSARAERRRDNCPSAAARGTVLRPASNHAADSAGQAKNVADTHESGNAVLSDRSQPCRGHATALPARGLATKFTWHNLRPHISGHTMRQLCEDAVCRFMWRVQIAVKNRFGHVNLTKI